MQLWLKTSICQLKMEARGLVHVTNPQMSTSAEWLSTNMPCVSAVTQIPIAVHVILFFTFSTPFNPPLVSHGFGWLHLCAIWLKLYHRTIIFQAKFSRLVSSLDQCDVAVRLRFVTGMEDPHLDSHMAASKCERCVGLGDRAWNVPNIWADLVFSPKVETIQLPVDKSIGTLFLGAGWAALHLPAIEQLLLNLPDEEKRSAGPHFSAIQISEVQSIHHGGQVRFSDSTGIGDSEGSFFQSIVIPSCRHFGGFGRGCRFQVPRNATPTPWPDASCALACLGFTRDHHDLQIKNIT